MKMNTVSAKLRIAVWLVIAALLVPAAASAGVGNILSLLTAITNTLSNGIGQALNGIQTIEANIRHFEQELVWPVSLLNEARASVSEIHARFSTLAGEIHRIRSVNATLQSPSRLETLLQSAQTQQIKDISSRYAEVYLPVPRIDHATEIQRNLIDIGDASALAGLKTAVISDEASDQMLGLADALEQETAICAPGSAPILAAQADVATLQSQAMLQRMLAAELRLQATKLAHNNALLKQSAENMKRLRNDMQQILNRP